MFRKKKKNIFAKLENFLKQAEGCRLNFEKCMENYITRDTGFRDLSLADQVHKAESLMDDIRREIEIDLYNKALIPESREDLLGIMETLDKIPNLFQSISYQISLQNINIPPSLKEEFKELTALNMKTFGAINQAVEGFLLKENVNTLITEIDGLESESDKIERSLIRKVFTLPIEKADMILLKEVIIALGDISDYALSVADRLNLAIIKRRI